MQLDDLTFISYVVLIIIEYKTCVYACRSSSSPNKKASKKLFTGEEVEDGNDTGAGATGAVDQARYLSVNF